MFCVYQVLSTGACAYITIREIMLINIVSSASWTLHWLVMGFNVPSTEQGHLRTMKSDKNAVSLPESGEQRYIKAVKNNNQNESRLGLAVRR